MNYGRNVDTDSAWSYVAAPAVMASPDTLHRNVEDRSGWHSPQQQVAVRKHLGALLTMDPNRSPFTPVGAELSGYPSPSPGQIYMPVSPTNIALPLSAPTSPYTAFGPQLPVYLTPNATAAPSPSHVAANDMKEETVVSVATTFYPGNPDVFPGPDMILASDEGTLFYINSQVLAVSGFKVPVTPPLNGLSTSNMTSLPQSPFLPQGSVNKLPDSSVTLSIIFHTIYNLTCASFSPSLDAISHAISRMPEYGITPATLIQPGTALYLYLMAQYAPLQALALYTLAARHAIEHLAVDVSSHLLGLSLSEITDDIAAAMGSVYLKRLFFMHKGRIERLKNVIAKPPVLHQDVSKECDHVKQSALRRKWALLITSLAWDARPDISPHAIKQHLRLTGDNIPCKRCRGSWMERVVEAATEWATVKFTI